MAQTYIKNARLIDPESGTDQIGDILFTGATIIDLGENINPEDISDEAMIIDAEGLICAPGLIDMRVITGEPGREAKESLRSASAAAAAGGITSLVLMPQTKPVIDNVALLDHLLRKGAEQADVNIYCAAALTTGLEGERMTEIGLLREAGALYFSNGEQPITDSQIMRRMLSYSSGFNALIAHRALDPDLSAGSCAHESDFSARLGLSGHPATAERIMIERDIALAELTGGRLLIDLVSSEEGLKVIRRAKQQDLDIAATVSINHLALNELDIGDYRTFAKLDPPLREEKDRQALLAAVNDGIIDVIVSSHDPRPAGQKRLPYEQAYSGAVGLETLLSAGLTLAADDQIDLMAFLKALTINPANLLDLPSGRLRQGAPADIILIDPDTPWVCDADKLQSLSKNTPFDGRHMIGKTVMSWVGGKLVFGNI